MTTDPLWEIIADTQVHRVEVGRARVAASIAYTVGATATQRRLHPDVVRAHERRSPSTRAAAYRMLGRTPVIAKVLRCCTLGDLACFRKSPATGCGGRDADGCGDADFRAGATERRRTDTVPFGEQHSITQPAPSDVSYSVATDSHAASVRVAHLPERH